MARKIDPTKSAEENLYTLISSNNSGLEVNSSKVTLGTPTPLSTPIGSRDTELPLTAVNNKGFSGTAKVRYNRLQLDQNVASASKSFNLLNSSETFDSLKARICTAWSLIPSEVVFNNGQLWTLPTDQGSSKTLSIQPKAGSLVYNGDLINLTITLPVPAAGYADFVKFLTDTYGAVSTSKTETVGERVKSGGYTVTDLTGQATVYTDGSIQFDSVIQSLIKRPVFSQAVRDDYVANKRVFGIVYGANRVEGNYQVIQVPTLYYWDEAAQKAMVVLTPFATTPGTSSPLTLDTGEVVFTTPGTYQWTVPAGVYSVNAVAVGGGAGVETGYGAGGGGLGWKNNIPVTPGDVITVVVGKGGDATTTLATYSGNRYRVGEDSYFKSATLVKGGGGQLGAPAGANGGSFVGDGGGNGGTGSVSGGGGAGGYSGRGGGGGNGAGSAGEAGTGGAAGGGGSSGSYRGGGGGGTGLEGEISNTGAGGDSSGTGGKGGSGGTNGTDGTASTNYSRGGLYGGGAGGGGSAVNPGGNGAVRVIWGAGRAFPKTKTLQVYSKSITLNGPYTPIDIKGETVFTKVGRNSFVVPDGVTSLSAVTVSGGAAMARGAGAGGTTAWKNNIPVTPGETLFVDVGPGQSQSSSTSLRTAIYRGTTLLMVSEGPNGVNPGSFTADGGGLGGAGYLFNDGSGGGGGGAGGYTDKGGDWGSSYVYGTGTPGKGGGGGAGGNPGSDGTSLSNAGAGGGGVGLMGQGANGDGGQAGTTNSGGKGGSGGDNASPVTSLSQVSGTSGAKFGGGAGGPLKNNVNATSVVGGQGGARLVWGKGRAFPATNVSQAYSDTIRNVA